MTSPEATPLVDDATLEMLRDMMGEQEFATLVGNAIASYPGYCIAMEQPGTSADAIRRHAHKLKGSSGTLGLVALQACAARVEVAAQQDAAAVPALLPALRDVIAATRRALAARGLAPVL